ncbi:hypothetical protein [Gluconacetobacter azotocaptans]|uniref:hypothetical protein n=1 Tax=Gluconacetobacter azotocaptans TaxID=142834 RepID=UPI001FD4F0A1|nr:hypothetical protein [Gluconacetobacter azotocaptans]GBQ29778.1 hypothetical protein AA13594_1475 [Gluconacetobacter azotocaptans DSM 13594]
MKTILLTLVGALALAAPARAQVAGPVGHGELPSCPDAGGNHLNYVPATGAFSCGTSGGVPVLANGTVLGNVSGGAAVAAALTPAQVTGLIQPFTAGLPGAVPAIVQSQVVAMTGGRWSFRCRTRRRRGTCCCSWERSGISRPRSSRDGPRCGSTPPRPPTG